MVTYSEIRPKLKTGDVVLFSGKGGISEWIKWFTGSQWSHVGLVLELEDFNSVLLWESTTLSNLADVETGKAHRGVQLVGLRERIKSYNGDQIAIRRLSKRLDGDMLKILGQFRSTVSGRPYEQSKIELIRSASTMFPNDEEDLSSLFCSELIAEAFQEMGLLDKTAKNSNNFTPEDFSSEADTTLPLIQGYKLQKEIFVTLA